MTIKLYELCGADTAHAFSPHCWKTRMSLAHKGLDFETVGVPFSQVAGIEGGGRKVPVIRDGETVVEESLEIARYLDKAYPEAPTLLGGATGEALTQFIIAWTQANFNAAVTKVALMDIYDALAPADQEHFRTTREKIFGSTLEEFAAKFPKDGKEIAGVLKSLDLMLKQQPFIGGQSPLFADYVVFGAMQWARTTAKTDVLPKGTPSADWFDRLLDMYDGEGRKVATAA